MAKFKRIQSSSIVLACMLPVGLAACGSSASAPSAGHSTASNASNAGSTQASTGSGSGSTGTSTGTATTPLGATGDAVGTVVESAGTTTAATGASLTNGALNNPVGITVLNNSTPGTGAGNIVDANVLSNTAPSTAPVAANVLSNGQIVSLKIANPGMAQIPGATSLLNGIPAGSAALTPVTNQIQPAVAEVGAATSGATAALNPLLNVQVGKTSIIGSSTTPAAINADVATPGQLANVAVTSPSTEQTHGALGGGNVLTPLTSGLTGVLNTTPLGSLPLGSLAK